MTIYTLSNSQRKALLIRSEELLLALPAPLVDPPDLLAWARQSIAWDAPLTPAVLRSAEEDELAVAPAVSRQQLALADVLGAIHTAPRPEQWAIPLPVVLCRLALTDPPRHRARQPQWPANVLVNGRALLAPALAPAR